MSEPPRQTLSIWRAEADGEDGLAQVVRVLEEEFNRRFRGRDLRGRCWGP